MAAPPAKGKAPAKGGGPGYQVSGVYDISSGGITRKNQSCPKCGPGFFMGNHKDRVSCGKCGYTEMKSKK